MGVLPLQFIDDNNSNNLGLSGFEKYSIIENEIKVKGKLIVETDTGKKFEVLVRIDTERELDYFRNGGIL